MWFYQSIMIWTETSIKSIKGNLNNRGINGERNHSLMVFRGKMFAMVTNMKRSSPLWNKKQAGTIVHNLDFAISLKSGKKIAKEWTLLELTQLLSIISKPWIFLSILFPNIFGVQHVHDDDRLISGFISLSSSKETIPKWEGSSSIIFATRYPAIDHVWNLRACFPIYLPSFPS